LHLKPKFETVKPSVCLSDIIAAHNLTDRDAEKLERYCRIEFKGARTTLSAKDIELHAWAAGIMPDKILGGPVAIVKATSLQLPTDASTALRNGDPRTGRSDRGKKAERIRRGSAVQLVLRSKHMQIAREANTLADAFAGETVEVRPHGTRRTLRAKLVSNSIAELIE